MASHRPTASSDATKPSEQEIKAARKDFKEALAAEHGKWLSRYKRYTKDEDYLQQFSDSAEILLLDIAAELDLSWEDLKTNVFEPAKYDMEKQRRFQPLYGGMQEAARNRRKKREAKRPRSQVPRRPQAPTETQNNYVGLK